MHENANYFQYLISRTHPWLNSLRILGRLNKQQSYPQHQTSCQSQMVCVEIHITKTLEFYPEVPFVFYSTLLHPRMVEIFLSCCHHAAYSQLTVQQLILSFKQNFLSTYERVLYCTARELLRKETINKNMLFFCFWFISVQCSWWVYYKKNKNVHWWITRSPSLLFPEAAERSLHLLTLWKWGNVHTGWSFWSKPGVPTENLWMLKYFWITEVTKFPFLK